MVTVTVTGVPLQLPTTGVAVMVAVCAIATLAAVKLILPLPLAGSPIAGLLLVQLTVAPGEALNAIPATSRPQACTGAGCSSVGAGLTVMVNVWGLPVQLPPGVIKLPNAIGEMPAGICAISIFVVASITDTISSRILATYTNLPSDVTLIPKGPARAMLPTGIVAMTILVAGSITLTVPEFWLVTYTRVPSGLIAIP